MVRYCLLNIYFSCIQGMNVSQIPKLCKNELLIYIYTCIYIIEKTKGKRTRKKNYETIQTIK